MRISADFTHIPRQYAKGADSQYCLQGIPVVSFPFYIDALDDSKQYLHWAFTDPDSIPVVGFEWIHWTVANVPKLALMFDFNDSHALQVPEDFTHTMVSMIPEAVQGRNSRASVLVRDNNVQTSCRYNGPQPPDKDHVYQLMVWATDKPLEGLREGFWLNEMFKAIAKADNYADQGGMQLVGDAN